MTTLTLKRGKRSRSSGQWLDEDYDVIADGKDAGRILEEGSRFGPPELRWGWSMFVVPATPGRDERHRRDARRSDGEVSRGVGEGEGALPRLKLFLMHADQRHSKHFPARSISDNDLIARDLPRALVPCEVLGHSHCLLHCIDNGR
jgi:hypothetical protein